MLTVHIYRGWQTHWLWSGRECFDFNIGLARYRESWTLSLLLVSICYTPASEAGPR